MGGKKNAPSDVLQRDGGIVWLKPRNGHRLFMTGATEGLQVERGLAVDILRLYVIVMMINAPFLCNFYSHLVGSST